MIFLQDLGEYDLADENFLDVQSITDAMMTTAQSLTELAIRFFLNLAVCWVIVAPWACSPSSASSGTGRRPSPSGR